jgi:ribosome-associated protein
MVEDDRIVLSPKISIPLADLEIRFIRSSGPGGQHVNKTSSQAEIVFDLNSAHMPEEDRAWLLSRLSSKLDSEGRLRITAQTQRSQSQNKSEAIEKLDAMLTEALKRPKKRKKTKPTRSAVEKRLASKKRASDKKKSRNERF